MLRRDGVIDKLGEDHIYGNVYEAAADQLPDSQINEGVTKNENA